MITSETLRKLAPKIKDPEIHANALEEARKTSSVTTLRRLCHFMGQIFVETGGFANMSEYLDYKTQTTSTSYSQRCMGSRMLVT
jgi:putative chitinase